jgi:hypothetical protein
VQRAADAFRLPPASGAVTRPDPYRHVARNRHSCELDEAEKAAKGKIDYEAQSARQARAYEVLERDDMGLNR